MRLSASPFPRYPHVLLAGLALFAVLGLGACSRSTRLTDPIATPEKSGAEATAKGGVGVAKVKAPPPAPTLAAPADGAVDVAVSPTLSWNAAATATSYRLQVSTSADFSSGMAADVSGIGSTSRSVSGLAASTKYFWRVSARNKGGVGDFSTSRNFTTGAAPVPPPPPPPPPPPVSKDPCASFSGLGGAVVATLADVPQFRIDRLRIEVTGDVTAGTIDAMGKCTSASPIRDSFISGTGDVRISGSGASGTATGHPLTFGTLLIPPGETGVVLATDAAGNVLEVIWPALAGLGPGQPILRLQLQSYSSAVQAGVRIDADMTFVARAPDGTTATFTVQGRNMVVPPLR